ncbi:TolC family protein, partial [Pseudomonas aeruginosa]
MSIPLYAGGGVSAAVRSAAASKAQSEAELDDAIRGAVVSTNQAWLGLIGGLARIRALEASKISAQSALDSNRIGYRV